MHLLFKTVALNMIITYICFRFNAQLLFMSFGKRLKKARQDKGIPQTQLGELVGVHDSDRKIRSQRRKARR